jgi:uncharacterized protein YhbP (UPF0306 family)
LLAVFAQGVVVGQRQCKGPRMTEANRHSPRMQRRIAMVAAFLRTQSTLVLASSAEEPRATPLFYLPTDALDLFWLSSSKSRHSAQVAARQEASVAVFAPTFAWREIVGVQMEGLCAVVTGEERTPLLAAYCERFRLGTIFSMAIGQSTLYRFRPYWLRYSDNRRRFGYRFEIKL